MAQIGLISDIQGNAVALAAVLAKLAPYRPARIVNLGDSFCGPQPLAVWEMLQTHKTVNVMGNMDAAYLRTGLAGLASGSENDYPFAELDQWALTQLSEAALTAMRQSFIPIQTLVFDATRRLVAVHGAPNQFEFAIHADSPSDAMVAEALAEWPALVYAVGHTHAPFERMVGESQIVNPGSVGWPDPDESGRRPCQAHYAVLDITPTSLAVRFEQVAYDPAEWQAAVLEAGIPYPARYLNFWQA